MKCSLQAAPWPQCFLPTTSTWESAWQLIQVPWWTFCWSRLWNTLRWFPSKFGLPGPDSMARLKAKRKTIQEGLVDTHIKLPRKAQLHPKRAYWHGKRLQPGDFAVTTGTDKLSPKQLMDKYICAMVTFQVACCSPVRRSINIPTSSHSGRPKSPQGRASWRWRGSLRENVGSLHLCNDQIPSGLQRPVNDLQHTSPTGCKLKETTPEFQAWQTKTVRAFRIKKNPAPLIAPLYSFTGLDWWSILPQAWDGLVAQEKFKDMDYLIPRLSHSHDQLRLHGVDPSP